MAERFEVRKDVGLDATPEQVWEAIASGPGLATWFMPMEVDADSEMVVAWEPGKRLAIETPPDDDGSTQAFEYLIETSGGGTTVLRFVHSGLLGDDWSDEFEAMTGMGWDMYLYTLAQYFRHFAGRAAVYVEAEGPPSSATDAAWPLLVRALGVEVPIEPGTAVHIDVGVTGPLDGVVDYVSSNFVGVRTVDALVRFHGRAPLGLPVAVSHHAYGEPFDAPAMTQAWEAWLAGAFTGNHSNPS
jgi:uncharacterized protein YndB with AHSA1/START domain